MCVREPVKILVEKEKISVKAIKNFFVNVEYEKNKYDNLIDIYQKLNICQAVIFVNSIKKAEYLADMLQGSGHSVGVIHSDMDEKSKNLTLKNFRLSQTRILIGTDLISRGIDVQQVGIVINYDVPHDSDKYIHRVGRSGRFGRLGVAITFMTGTRDDIEKMKQIEYDYNIDFEELNNTKDIEKINDYLTGTKSN
jgi:superfamily II DNA/RNA helicase